jgi:hypothetical protein
MRWKLWDNEKDGFPPKYAVVLNDGTSTRCMVLQECFKTYEDIECKHPKSPIFWIWKDIPLHIERKE